MKRNRGFTLVELVVAMTVSAVLAVGIVSLIAMTFNQYRTTRVEAQVQIEGQTISEYIKAIMNGCEEYHFAKVENSGKDEAFLEVKTRHHSEPNVLYEDNTPTGEIASVGWYYFYFDLDSRQCYVTYQDDQLGEDERIDSIFMRENESGEQELNPDAYLGQYVESVNIIPKNYAWNNKTKIEEYKYNVTLQMYLRDVDYEQQIDTHFKIRSR